MIYAEAAGLFQADIYMPGLCLWWRLMINKWFSTGSPKTYRTDSARLYVIQRLHPIVEPPNKIAPLSHRDAYDNTPYRKTDRRTPVGFIASLY